MEHGKEIELPVVVNNLDVDFTNDIRRAVPSAITSFYANAFPNQVVVRPHEVDTYFQDTGYIQYIVVSLMVVSIMLGHAAPSRIKSAREYEKGTIKELILAPANPLAIQVGKIPAPFYSSSSSVVVMIIVIVTFDWCLAITLGRISWLCIVTHGNILTAGTP